MVGNDFVLVATGPESLAYTVSNNSYIDVGNRIVQACEDNPEHIEAIQKYFLEADRDDLFYPKEWHARTYGNKDKSIEFARIIEEFEPNDRLVVRKFIGDKHLEEKLAELVPEA